MRNYKKGDKIIYDGQELYYISNFTSDEGENFLACGGLGGFMMVVPESEAVFVESPFEDRVLSVLTDISSSIKDLNEAVETVLGLGQKKPEDEFDNDDDMPDDLN